MSFCVKCGEPYNPKRKELGYRTCLDCGSPKYCPPVIPVNKSNYIIGSLHELKTCSYAAKGTK